MAINIGISEQDRTTIAKGLSRLLADTYTLYLKTHNYHWNVTGPMFQPLHTVFEKEYNDLALAVDQIAERIRTLGMPAPGSYSEYAKLATIKEETGNPTSNEMLQTLVEDNETVVRTARSIIEEIEKAKDESSLELITGRMTVHEKTAWMLRSFLE